MPVSGNVDRQLAKLAFECLFALAVTGVACGVLYRFIFAMTKVVGHFDFERFFHQQLGELLEQPILSNQVFWPPVLLQ